MLRGRNGWAGAVSAGVLLWAIAPSVAWAAFTINGATATDTFDGTSKDLSTWEQRVPSGTSITQNNELTFASSPFDSADYTTRSVAVPVGGTVRADARLQTTGTQASAFLGLTSNSGGTGTGFFSESYLLYIQFSGNGAATGYTINGTGPGQGHTLSVPDNTPVILEIARNSSTNATFNVYNASQVILATHTMGVPDNPASLFVVLSGGGQGTATMDNVTVPTSAIPEPAGVCVIGFTVAALRRRR